MMSKYMEYKCKTWDFFLISLLLITFGCHSSDEGKAIISGQLSNLKGARIKINAIIPGKIGPVDSIMADEEGNFEYTFSPAEQGFYKISAGSKNYFYTSIGKNQHLKFGGNAENLPGSLHIIEGAEFTKELITFSKLESVARKQLDSLSTVFQLSQSSPEFPLIKKELDSVYYAIFDHYKRGVKAYIENNLSSFASLFIINQSFGQMPVFELHRDESLFFSLDSALRKSYGTNSYYQALHKEVGRYKELKTKQGNQDELIGKSAPDVRLKDQSGNMKKVDFKTKKMVLLYFWASWNASSRNANVELAGLYQEFHTRGFEICAVSLDQDQQKWKEAILRDKAYWTQLIDPTGLESEVAKEYKIKQLPTFFLIEQQGKIIGSMTDISELKHYLMNKL